ncbi:hypothetical protein HXX76_013577 [Chlamydomonas incerta]|uniref:Uncharacterized protein n=1 Tax=Chlamydomonas incerta TaxID=51695 RepID=A0A835VTR0_CHLIN|nr:hypothetical protein HXX76_013577 [Chlamydomonas incerta]|eukprot:KAG2425533.1 hypothetical protein HXX76_013577 [Chlamydomonas incerta]
MTESIGSGIIASIWGAQLCQMFLKRTVGTHCNWAVSCAINSFVYTITVMMMGTSSAIFNPAVAFAWAMLGRVKWQTWVVMVFAELAGGIVGLLCAYSQFIPHLHRVPIPKKDAEGKWIYAHVEGWKWVYCMWKPKVFTPEYWITAPRCVWKRYPVPWYQGGDVWDTPEYNSTDAAAEGLLRDGRIPAELYLAGGGGSAAQRRSRSKHGGKALEEATGVEEVDIDVELEEMRKLAATPDYAAELRRDQKAKLMCFAETPMFYCPLWTWQWWPHFMAGTTLCHWLSFMTGNCVQLTNTNMYLVQPTQAPGSQYSFLNAYMLAWLMGLAYFLLSASAGGVCTLQLNPAQDLAARFLHWVLPIPNKGHSGWSYSPIPLVMPFMGAVFGVCLMYMSMWSKLSFPYTPYGNMPQWF